MRQVQQRAPCTTEVAISGSSSPPVLPCPASPTRRLPPRHALRCTMAMGSRRTKPMRYQHQSFKHRQA